MIEFFFRETVIFHILNQQWTNLQKFRGIKNGVIYKQIYKTMSFVVYGWPFLIFPCTILIDTLMLDLMHQNKTVDLRGAVKILLHLCKCIFMLNIL